MKHLDPRQLPEWLQMEIDQQEEARRRHVRGRLFAALAAGLVAATVLWGVGAYDGIWPSTSIVASR